MHEYVAAQCSSLLSPPAKNQQIYPTAASCVALKWGGKGREGKGRENKGRPGGRERERGRERESERERDCASTVFLEKLEEEAAAHRQPETRTPQLRNTACIDNTIL